ncbi:MAG: hypothetical protein R3Y05_05520 [bacterium]
MIILIVSAILGVYVANQNLKTENEYIEYWDNNIIEVNALVTKCELDSISNNKYYYSITFEFTVNNEVISKTLIISNDNGYPYKKDDKTIIYVNEFNEIENLTMYENKKVSWIISIVLFLIVIILSVGGFAIFFKD